MRPLDRDLGVLVADVLGLAAEPVDILLDPAGILLACARVDDEIVMIVGDLVNDDVVHEGGFRIQHGRVVRLAGDEPRGVVHGDALHGIQRLRPGEADVAHVADVEDAHAGAHRHVLGQDAAGRGIFHRHVPAAKIHHLGAHLAMDRVERSFSQGRAGLSHG